MKYFFVYKQSTSNPTELEHRGVYKTVEEAKANLLSTALYFVKSDGGERQEKMALQNDKTVDQISSDNSLSAGYYLKENDGMIELYEKLIKDTGWIMKNEVFFCEKRAVFFVSKDGVEIEPEYREKYINMQTSKVSSTDTYAHVSKKETISEVKVENTFLLDALKELFEKKDPKMGLSPVTDRNLKDLDKSITFEEKLQKKKDDIMHKKKKSKSLPHVESPKIVVPPLNLTLCKKKGVKVAKPIVAQHVIPIIAQHVIPLAEQLAAQRVKVLGGSI